MLLFYNKYLKTKWVVYRLPSALQFGASDLGFPFVGSGGEPTEVVGLDQKFEEQKPEDESGTVWWGHGDGPVDDGTAETEVNFCLPRGYDPGPDRVPKKIPIVMGAVKAVTPDPGQTCRLGPLSGANRNVWVAKLGAWL